MFGPALETAIGLALVFLLVSLLCSALVEAVANLFKKRAKYLLRGLHDLLQTPTAREPGMRLTTITDARTEENRLYETALEAVPAAVPPAPGTAGAPAGAAHATATGFPTVAELMRHPLLSALKQSRAGGGLTRNPSYVPARTFAAALVDLLVTDSSQNTNLATIRDAIKALPESPPRRALLALLKDAGDSVDRFRENLEGWYDAQMDRISGAYKRWAKRWLIVFGLAAALLLNIDAIQVGRALYSDEPLRQAVAAAAANGSLCEQGQDLADTRACVTDTLDDLDAAGLPVGWPMDDRPDTGLEWIAKLLGLLLTAGAATFGAPFWFDLLNRFGSLRNAGGRPRSSSAENS
jgi:hypothetical protein